MEIIPAKTWWWIALPKREGRQGCHRQFPPYAPQGEPIVIDWRLKRTGEGYRIIDVATEGVSLAITLRAEYGSFLKREGDVAALAAALEKRVVADGVSQAKADTKTPQ